MRFAFLALFAGLLSCQTATQITVKLRGVGVTCPAGASPTIEQTGVLAKRQLQSPADLPELSVLGEQCAAEGSVVSLGDIVLVPADGPGPVEVLALGALKVGDGPAVSADDCRAEYERLFGAPCEIGEGFACESCIFARRSIAFVKHSKLEVTVDLEASCAGIICDPSKTCSKGTCVSAEASCEDDGSCTLVNENQGGAGGEGGTGAGGDGGGGSGPGVWATLWEPAISNCTGADPSDVIGGLVNGEQGPTFRVLVAAGPCMLVLDDGATPTELTPAAGTNGNDYRAVAKGANGDFISFGDRGSARLQSTPPFSILNEQLTSFDPTDVGVAWDIATAGTANPIAWTRTYPDGSGTSGQIVPFATGALDSIFRGALFAVYPLGNDSQPITFGAWAGTVAARRGANTTSTIVTTPSGWSIWAEELADDAGTFQVVAVGTKTDAVYIGRCTDTVAGADENCDFVVEPIGLVPSPAASSRKVAAIWGAQTTVGVALYAVGDNGGVGPWLGRAVLPDSLPSEPLVWTFAELPPEMRADGGQAVRSVWVGLTGGTGASVVVAGPAGVFRAQLDQLPFTMEP